MADDDDDDDDDVLLLTATDCVLRFRQIRKKNVNFLSQPIPAQAAYA